MNLASFFRSARRGWWIVVVSVLACLGLAGVVTVATVPVYESTVKFYVYAPTATGQSALQADELARLRIVGYASLLTSERVVDQISKASRVDLPVDEVAKKITAYGDSETLILTVNVRDEQKADAVALASAIASNFNRMVNDLEGAGSTPGNETVLNVVAGPTENDNPVSPRETLNYGLGLLIGLAVGLAILVRRSRADRTLRHASEVEAVTGLRLLATAPAEKKMSRHDAGRTADSLQLEVARTLRTNLHFRSDGESLRAIAVTSAQHGEGKSTVAQHLAMSCADAGYRTLLVETDLRQPRLAERFGLESAAGLAELITGQADLRSVAAPTSRADLWVLPAGKGTSRASELLSRSSLESVLAGAKNAYDVVILDTPPLLPFVDARIVCALSDGVVVVTRHGVSTPDTVSAGLETLALVKANVLGTVFNGLPVRRGMLTEGREERAAAPSVRPSAAPAAPRATGGDGSARNDTVHTGRVES